MRARAFYVLQNFSDLKIQNPAVLQEIMRVTANALLTDQDMPVKLEASIALQMYLTSQEHISQHIQAQIKPITFEILKLVREIEIEDVTNVMQKLVCTFPEEIEPIAVEICQDLARTFTLIFEGDENSDDKAMAAMGILNIIETLLSVMEDNQAIMAKLQSIVINVIGHIFQQSVMGMFSHYYLYNIIPCLKILLLFHIFQNSMKKHSH